MHIPDGFVSGMINLGAAGVSLLAIGASLRKISRNLAGEAHKMPLLAMTAAFVFAAQMLNFPIGGGTSGHFLGAALVAALLGPAGACVVLALVLMIQGLLFGDGGLTALGTNVLNMGLVAGLGGYYSMRLLRGILPAGKTYYLLSAGVGSWLSVVLASLACSLELAFSGTSPWAIVLPAMVSTHVIIGIGEGLITAGALSAIATSRPEILPDWSRLSAIPPAVRDAELTPRMKARRVFGVVITGLILAGGLAAFCSPFASEAPDGLEKVADEYGFSNAGENAAIWKASPLPDYTTPDLQNATASTGLAGVIGTVCVFFAGYVLIRVIRMRAQRSAAIAVNSSGQA